MRVSKTFQFAALACATFGNPLHALGGDGSTEQLANAMTAQGCQAPYGDRFNSSAKDIFTLAVRLYGNSGDLTPTASTGFDAGTGLTTGVTALAAMRNTINTTGSPVEDWNYYSAFQLGCGTVGSYINTWTWPQGVVQGGGPNTGYSIEFTNAVPLFDANYNELWLQLDKATLAYINSWGGIGQLVLVAFLEATTAGGNTQRFQVLSQLYDSRSDYFYRFAPQVGYDTATNMPYATTPHMTLENAYLSTGHEFQFASWRTGIGSWSDKFRVQIAGHNLASIVADINSYCSEQRTKPMPPPNCQEDLPLPQPPYTYKIKKAVLLHEVFYTNFGHIAMGTNAEGFGVYRYARPSGDRPGVSLMQSRSSTASGSPYLISWRATDATSCRITKTLNEVVQFGDLNPWDTALSGSKVVAPAAPGTHVFFAQCTGPGGSSTVSSFVHTVTCPAGKRISGSGASTSCVPGTAPSAYIKGMSPSGPSGTGFGVYWSSQNATSCTVTKLLNGVPNPWATGTSGSKVAAPTLTGTHVYVNNCVGPGGEASNTATFTHVVTGG